MLTDDMLVHEHIRADSIGGVQRVYRLPNGYGLSLVNGEILHSYPFAWEAAVVTDVTDTGKFSDLSYDTQLTDDVEVFMTDDEANAFISRAKEWALSSQN